MKRIVLWRGSHDAEFPALMARALRQEILLIACPPVVEDFHFLSLLPPGEVELAGKWDGIEAPRRAGGVAYPVDPCLGLFTSATTERAKLVLYTRENVEVCAQSIFALFQRERIKRVFCYPQPFHTFGLTLGYAAAQLFGWQLVAPQGKYTRRHHEEWLGAMGPNTLSLGTPTHFLDLAHFLKETGASPSPSYSAIVGGARVTRALWLSLRDDLGIEAPSIGYGATEASPGVTHLPPGFEPREDGEVGWPLAHLAVEVDPLSGVRITGASVCCALIEGRKLEFQDHFVLPDLLSARADGSLVYRGRAKFTLNRGGQKILLEAIEREVQVHFGQEALAFSVPEPRLGEELGLFLQATRGDSSATPEKIAVRLREKFGINFSTSYFRVVEQIPMNASHKPDRRAALGILDLKGSAMAAAADSALLV